jgi:hypothetical protein
VCIYFNIGESIASVDSIVSCRTDTKNRGEMYDDRQLSDSEVTTEASDIYNVYYPVMEAQVVTDNNGKACRNTKHIHTRNFCTIQLLCLWCSGLFYDDVRVSNYI